MSFELLSLTWSFGFKNPTVRAQNPPKAAEAALIDKQRSLKYPAEKGVANIKPTEQSCSAESKMDTARLTPATWATYKAAITNTTWKTKNEDKRTGELDSAKYALALSKYVEQVDIESNLYSQII